MSLSAVIGLSVRVGLQFSLVLEGITTFEKANLIFEVLLIEWALALQPRSR